MARDFKRTGPRRRPGVRPRPRRRGGRRRPGRERGGGHARTLGDASIARGGGSVPPRRRARASPRLRASRDGATRRRVVRTRGSQPHGTALPRAAPRETIRVLGGRAPGRGRTSDRHPAQPRGPRPLPPRGGSPSEDQIRRGGGARRLSPRGARVADGDARAAPGPGAVHRRGAGRRAGEARRHSPRARVQVAGACSRETPRGHARRRTIPRRPHRRGGRPAGSGEGRERGADFPCGEWEER
mmetsp:Transcript_2057/g.9059  ORF Transcript_2057/g.9059 Transcript_2057/m.9059 type:complete len:242 (+) Transcript_2057:179-904(+)